MFTLKNQKGLSPLIATILLVAVALSLAGILYSWSSQNAKETTGNLTDTTNEWMDCSAIDIYIDNGCVYDSEDGISFILYDKSTVEIDDNLILTVIDANNTIRSASIEPNFTGFAMAINSTVISNASEFQNLVKPIKRVSVQVKSCPDRVTYIQKCG